MTIRRAAAFFAVLALGAGPIRAQQPSLIERRLVAGDSGAGTLRLAARVLYWAELTGPGIPVVQGAGTRRLSPPVIVPVGDQSSNHRRFEIHPRESGFYEVSVSGLASSDSTLIRFYRGVRGHIGHSTQDDADNFIIGVALRYGRHSGYRLDPTGGANPRGGSDAELGLLLSPAGRFETLLGLTSSALPDAGYHVTWGFFEEDARLLDGHLPGDRHASLRLGLRYSKGFSAGTRNLSPAELGIGANAVVVLTPGRTRGGVSLDLGWLHQRLGDAPETELLDADRFTLGLRWLP